MEESNQELHELNKSLLAECKKTLYEFRKFITAFKAEIEADREWLERQLKLRKDNKVSKQSEN
jgi:hypothetical protein